jgi:asparagine synthase (glutamine-hydrolysing)
VAEAAVDSEGLAELLVMGPSRTPGQGIFRGIAELKPACTMWHDRSGTRIEKYWQLRNIVHTDNLDTTAEKVKSLLTAAVLRQTISDVPLATFLSGGLDSSALTALVSKFFNEEGHGRLKSFSVDYLHNDTHFQASDFQPDPDSIWAGRVAKLLQTRHQNFTGQY